jgi:hypothetical protein
LRKPLVAGDRIDGELMFENARAIPVEFRVEAAGQTELPGKPRLDAGVAAVVDAVLPIGASPVDAGKSLASGTGVARARPRRLRASAVIRS